MDVVDDAGVFMQGDIIKDFPFPHLMKKTGSGDFDVVLRKQFVMVLNQSCDLVFGRTTNETFSFAPLITLSKIQEILSTKVSEIQVRDKIDSMKKNKSLAYLYLPHNEIIGEESFVVFSKITSLDIDILGRFIPIVRLSDKGRHFLTNKIYNYFCRAIDPTVSG